MIPLSTTTITVLRTPVADIYDEPYSGRGASTDYSSGVYGANIYGGGDRETVIAGVRAVIDRPPGKPTGKEQVAGGEQSTMDLNLSCDLCDMTHLDWVRDDLTGVVYRVIYVLIYPGFHLEAGLRVTEGVV